VYFQIPAPKPELHEQMKINDVDVFVPPGACFDSCLVNMILKLSLEAILALVVTAHAEA